MQLKQEQFWKRFLEETGRDAETPCYECFQFGIGADTANELLALVLSGKKRATSSAYPAYAENLPHVGDYSIVTDGAENPKCVIQTTSVQMIPFCELTFDTVRKEGEDDTLESWQQNHISFFTEEGAQQGYAFSPDMLVVFEEFEVVYPN